MLFFSFSLSFSLSPPSLSFPLSPLFWGRGDGGAECGVSPSQTGVEFSRFNTGVHMCDGVRWTCGSHSDSGHFLLAVSELFFS